MIASLSSVLHDPLQEGRKSTLQSYFITIMVILAVTTVTMSILGFLISRSIWITYTDSVIESSHEFAQRFNNTLIQAVEENGKLDSTLEHFQDIIAELPYGEDGFVCLIDKKDKVVSHPDAAMIGSQMDRSSFVDFKPSDNTLKQISRGLSYMAKTPEIKGEHMVYQLPANNLPWTVSVHTDLEAHRKRVFSIQKTTFLLSLPMIIIIPLIGGMLSRGISRKYERALQATNLKLERLVDERTKELQIAKLAAEDSDRLKSEFLAIMSHEYRTPLNGILGIGTLLKDSAETDEDNEMIDDLLKSGNRLNELMERILNFAETGSGQHKVRLKEQDFKTLEAMVESNLSDIMNDKGVEFEFKRPQSVQDNESVKTDDKLLTIAIRELFDNAAKFGNKTKVEVEMKVSNHQISISVKDRGIGIPEQQQKELFKPFNQLDQRTNRQFEGVGIGLVMVKRIAELLKGTVSVQSNPTIGTVFELTVPTQ